MGRCCAWGVYVKALGAVSSPSHKERGPGPERWGLPAPVSSSSRCSYPNLLVQGLGLPPAPASPPRLLKWGHPVFPKTVLGAIMKPTSVVCWVTLGKSLDFSNPLSSNQ